MGGMKWNILHSDICTFAQIIFLIFINSVNKATPGNASSIFDANKFIIISAFLSEWCGKWEICTHVASSSPMTFFLLTPLKPLQCVFVTLHTWMLSSRCESLFSRPSLNMHFILFTRKLFQRILCFLCSARRHIFTNQNEIKLYSFSNSSSSHVRRKAVTKKIIKI